MALNDYLTSFFASPCPPAYLGDQLECSLIRPEIRIVDHSVDIQYSYEANFLKIKAFSECSIHVLF